jgi:hypothetical protein
MATLRPWPLALALLLIGPAAAQASYKYTTTIRFSGTYTSDEYDSGTVVSHVQSKTSFMVHDKKLVITVKAGAIALYPSGHTTTRLATTQSGYRIMCDSARQTFTDRISHRPGRGWVLLKRRGSRASLGFGWSGESVDRHYIGVTQGDCTEPAEIEAAGGNDDEAGAPDMASRFGVSLKVPLSSLMRGRSIVRRLTVHKVQSDLLDGTGTKSRLDGTYRIILSRIG